MADAAADVKVYTYAEVAEHNTFEDCWMVIENKVMDVTKFLDEHPGGDEVMMSVAGQDGTDEFEDGEWALMCLTHAPDCWRALRRRLRSQWWRRRARWVAPL